MADIFLSYSSADRVSAERVQRVLAGAGHDVFLDQQTPPGEDWDSWIRGKLAAAKIVVVLWSKTSIASPNVRHEAMIARDAKKLVPVLIDTLVPSDFPMGLYMVQALNLVGWRGDSAAPNAQRLIAEADARIGRLREAAPRTQRPENHKTEAAPMPDPAWRRADITSEPQSRWFFLKTLSVLAGGVLLVVALAFLSQQIMNGSPAGIVEDQASSARTTTTVLEAQSFEAAQETDTIEAFEAFLTEFPESQYALQARGRIAELRVIPSSDVPDVRTPKGSSPSDP